MKRKTLTTMVLITYVVAVVLSFVPAGMTFADSSGIEGAPGYVEGLIAYEGFDGYTAGTLIGENANGGLGWKSSWLLGKNGNEMHYYKTSSVPLGLEYPAKELKADDYKFVGTPNHIVSTGWTAFNYPQGGRKFRNSSGDNLAQFLGGTDDQTVYFSFLANFPSEKPMISEDWNHMTGFMLVDSTGGAGYAAKNIDGLEVFRIGFGNGDGKVGLYVPKDKNSGDGNGVNQPHRLALSDGAEHKESKEEVILGSGTTKDWKFTPNKTHLYVVALTVNSNDDNFTVKVYADPELNSGDSTIDEDACIINYSGNGDQLEYGNTKDAAKKIDAINISGAGSQSTLRPHEMASFDEIRVGKNWASVVPVTQVEGDTSDDLIAYEGFSDYADDAKIDNTAGGGTGWYANWRTSNTEGIYSYRVTKDEEGLIYPDSIPQLEGFSLAGSPNYVRSLGSFYDGGPGGMTGETGGIHTLAFPQGGRLFRTPYSGNLTDYYGDEQDKIYISFLANLSAKDPWVWETWPEPAGISLVNSQQILLKDGSEAYNEPNITGVDVFRIYFGPNELSESSYESNNGSGSSRVGISVPNKLTREGINRRKKLVDSNSSNNYGTNAVNKEFRFNLSETNLYVIELELKSNNEYTIKVYVDPKLENVQNGVDENSLVLSYTGDGTEFAQFMPANSAQLIDAINITGAKANFAKFDEIRVGKTWESVLPTKYIEDDSFDLLADDHEMSAKALDELGYLPTYVGDYKNLIAYEGFNRFGESGSWMTNQDIAKSFNDLAIFRTADDKVFREANKAKGFYGTWYNNYSNVDRLQLALNDKLEDKAGSKYKVLNTDNYVYTSRYAGAALKKRLASHGTTDHETLQSTPNKWNDLYISFSARINEITTGTDRLGGIAFVNNWEASFRDGSHGEQETRNVGLYFDSTNGQIYLGRSGNVGDNNFNSGGLLRTVAEAAYDASDIATLDDGIAVNADETFRFNETNFYMLHIQKVDDDEFKIRAYMNPHAYLDTIEETYYENNDKVRGYLYDDMLGEGEIEPIAELTLPEFIITDLALMPNGTDFALSDIRMGKTVGSVAPLIAVNDKDVGNEGQLLVYEDFNYADGNLKEAGKASRENAANGIKLTNGSATAFYNELNKGFYGFRGKDKYTDGGGFSNANETFWWRELLHAGGTSGAFKVYNEPLSYEGLMSLNGKSIGSTSINYETSVLRQFNETTFRNKDEMWMSVLVDVQEGFAAGESHSTTFISPTSSYGRDRNNNDSRSSKSVGMLLRKDLEGSPYWALHRNDADDTVKDYSPATMGISGINYDISKGRVGVNNTEKVGNETALLVMHMKQARTGDIALGLNGTPLDDVEDGGVIASLYVNPVLYGNENLEEYLASRIVLTREQVKKGFLSFGEAFIITDNQTHYDNLKSIYINSCAKADYTPSVYIGDLRLGTSFRSVCPLAPRLTDIVVDLKNNNQSIPDLNGVGAGDELTLSINIDTTTNTDMAIVLGLYKDNGELTGKKIFTGADSKFIHKITKDTKLESYKFALGDATSVKIMFWDKNMTPYTEIPAGTIDNGTEQRLTIKKSVGDDSDYSGRIIEYTSN